MTLATFIAEVKERLEKACDTRNILEMERDPLFPKFDGLCSDLAKALAIIEVYQRALEEVSDKAQSKTEFTRTAFGVIANEALARADQIVKGEVSD